MSGAAGGFSRVGGSGTIGHQSPQTATKRTQPTEHNLTNTPPPQLNPPPKKSRYGGIYGYPGDAKNKNGKLRLLYECAPMSMIAEQAGGLGSTGQMRVMEVMPDAVHQRVPLFVGSKKEVEYLESFTKGKK